MKDGQGRHVFKDSRSSRKMHAVADVYERLVDDMSEKGLYDFDDMIVEVVHVLEQNSELQFNLQERFQYVLVDEFQDTNKAQSRMLYALGDNPSNENRPNIMAVGDDDQAIYAFQGAEVSNMVAFARKYSGPAIITLHDNYRSTKAILGVGADVAGQITDRLESLIPNTHKQLEVRIDHKNMLLTHTQFPSELAQYDWVAETIAAYIESGTKPEDIAVIAPRHRILERLMPYLGQKRIPVAYERRENILDSPIIIQLTSMAELVQAIADGRHDQSDELFGQVLSYEFWQIDDKDLIALSLDCYKNRRHWLEAVTESDVAGIRQIGDWFVALAKRASLEPLEYMLDQLVGGLSRGIDSEFDDVMLPAAKNDSAFVSPMRDAYFSQERYEDATDSYLTLLGQLSTLRQRLREWRPSDTLYIKDLVEFADLHRTAGLKIIDTNPHTQTTNAVQVMTAYKAKGLEFGVVFIVSAQDEVWGPTTRSRSSTIALPKNLPLAPASDGDNDRLRLLYVALTRAKHDLLVTSYSHSLSNKLSPGLSFIRDVTALQPTKLDKPASAQAVAILSTDWAYRFRQVIADKPTLFEPILNEYKLSVTHLNNFIDIVDSGPQYFLTHNLLRFPEAPTPSAAYGDAVHKTLQWAHNELRNSGSLPNMKLLTEYFEELLRRKHLKKNDTTRLLGRGNEALNLYFKARGAAMLQQDSIEVPFAHEGVVIDGANLTGKIDKLHFDSPGHVQVIDFKTGKPASDWHGKADYEKRKLHKYRQQLLFYKLLVEHSASYGRKLQVRSGGLEFIEPDEQDNLVDNLDLAYDEAELERFEKLVGSVWRHIMALDFPAADDYSKDMRGVLQFEQDLIDGK